MTNKNPDNNDDDEEGGDGTSGSPISNLVPKPGFWKSDNSTPLRKSNTYQAHSIVQSVSMAGNDGFDPNNPDTYPPLHTLSIKKVENGCSIALHNGWHLVYDEDHNPIGASIDFEGALVIARAPRPGRGYSR
ncbi:hypothetical protein [Rhizobium sp. BR 315]|uniref:hypothetical protein n=1 Tax=Rhizobium sp. BR 315 TaxID=3040014 RepID=UPI003D354FE4